MLDGSAYEHLEDRLSYLLQPGCPLGMKNWREALATKVLCIVERLDENDVEDITSMLALNLTAPILPIRAALLRR